MNYELVPAPTTFEQCDTNGDNVLDRGEFDAARAQAAAAQMQALQQVRAQTCQIMAAQVQALQSVDAMIAQQKQQLASLPLPPASTPSKQVAPKRPVWRAHKQTRTRTHTHTHTHTHPHTEFM